MLYKRLTLKTRDKNQIKLQLSKMTSYDFIQYGKGGAKEHAGVVSYFGPTKEMKEECKIVLHTQGALKAWQIFLTRVGDAHAIATHDITEDEMPFLIIQGKNLTGVITAQWLSTRTTLWNALWSDKTMRNTVSYLLDTGSVLNESVVCSGSAKGIFHRLERIKKTRDMAVTHRFGVDFYKYVEERWLWKDSDPSYFAKFTNGEAVLENIIFTGSADAGPGYVKRTPVLDYKGEQRLTEDGKPSYRYTNLKKGDVEAQEQAINVMNYMLTHVRDGQGLQQLFEEFRGWHTVQLKHKVDYYTPEQVFGKNIYGQTVEGAEPKTRPYFSFPFHLSAMFSVIMQRVGNVQVNYQEDPKSWSMIGHSWMHGGTQKLWYFLNCLEEYGKEYELFHALLFGDDAVYRFAFYLLEKGELKLVTICCFPDVKGMDFTLTQSATGDRGGFSGYISWKFDKWATAENLDGRDFAFPREWKAMTSLAGVLAVVPLIIYQGKHVLQLQTGLRSGIPGTTYFDEYQSLRITHVLESYWSHQLSKIQIQAREGKLDREGLLGAVQKVVKAAFTKLENKMGISFNPETTQCYYPDTFAKEKGFGSREVTPYTILGYRLTRFGGTFVPIKRNDDVWRSLIKPRTNYKHGGLADMVELERLRGVAMSSAWLYDNTYSFLKKYFEERRKSGKINLTGRRLAKPVSVGLYPVSSIPEDVLVAIGEDDPNLAQIIATHSDAAVDDLHKLIEGGEDDEHTGFTESWFKDLVRGNPDWFPSPKDIADLYMVEVAKVEREIVTIGDLVTGITKKDIKASANIFAAALSGAWGDLEQEFAMEIEEETKEEILGNLEDALPAEAISGLEVKVSEGKTTISRVGEIGMVRPAPLSGLPQQKKTELAVGKTSKNKKRLAELEKQRKAVAAQEAALKKAREALEKLSAQDKEEEIEEKPEPTGSERKKKKQGKPKTPKGARAVVRRRASSSSESPSSSLTYDHL